MIPISMQPMKKKTTETGLPLRTRLRSGKKDDIDDCAGKCLKEYPKKIDSITDLNRVFCVVFCKGHAASSFDHALTKTGQKRCFPVTLLSRWRDRIGVLMHWAQSHEAKIA